MYFFFSFLEASSTMVSLQVTAKLWHTSLFLLENVPSDSPEFRGNIPGALILLSEALIFFFSPLSLLLERGKVFRNYVDNR